MPSRHIVPRKVTLITSIYTHSIQPYGATRRSFDGIKNPTLQLRVTVETMSIAPFAGPRERSTRVDLDTTLVGTIALYMIETTALEALFWTFPTDPIVKA